MLSMSASNSRTAATRLGQYVAGPIITLATACVLELLKQDHVTLPNPGVPLTLTIVLSFFLSGSVPGSVSAVLAWLYNACYFSLPERPFQYTEENVERVMIAGLAIPALAVMLWFLKHRADQSAELVAFAARLETQLAEQNRSEARIRQAEAAGWDTARYLRTIFAAEPECVKLLAPDGTLLDMNPAGLAMLDCDSLAEAQSVPLCEFVAVEHRAAFGELHGQVMRGESRTLEFEFVSRRGSRRCVETHAVPLRDQGGQITALLGITRDITERKRAENQLLEYAARLRTLSGQTLASQENERRHIARELHDEIGQVLTAVAINLHAVRASAGSSAWPAVDESLDVVNQAIEQVRNMSLDLRPSMLDDLGLEAALRWHLDRQAQRGGFAVQFVSELAGQRPPPDIETVCFRVAQEALTNISRHAHATNVLVELRRCGDETLLIIQDNGAGFDVKSTRRRADRGHTFGLSGMHERVALAGGKIAVDSEPGRGTRICASFANRSEDSSVAGGLNDETDPNSLGGRS